MILADRQSLLPGTTRLSPQETDVPENPHSQILVLDAASLSRATPGRRSHPLRTRFFDVFVASFLLLLSSPIFILATLLIAATSRGSVIYRQRRHGQNGRTFVLYKFRTMVPNADAILATTPELKSAFDEHWKLDHDPRITKVGHWLRTSSIDELPQLFNVLRGDMSIVGPRPVQPVEITDWYRDTALVVFSVKPGLTGLWQVAGRSCTSYEQRIALDIEYLRRRSIWFDLQLLLRTIPAVLLMRGAR